MTSSQKKFKVIACESLARPVYGFSALSPHRIDIQLLQIGLHDQPNQLRRNIQDLINQVLPSDYDAVLLVYGLCGRAIDGLISADIPMIIPRAHDCITLLLGSREVYNNQQNENPGTYWYSQDYLERSNRYGQSMALGSGVITDQQNLFDLYVEKYGLENAEYLMETMTNWQKHYDRAVLVETEFGVTEDIRVKVKDQSTKHGWKLETMSGDLQLVKKLLFGNWDKDFLVVPPCHRVTMQFDEWIISATPLEH